mmetsp:Transcript_44671/g.106286  ORF Transcript_44671/g.106286 Transcript_44671/m.106286 type:complete len:215 (+) Transcript_44671:2297-2941(+)
MKDLGTKVTFPGPPVTGSLNARRTLPSAGNSCSGASRSSSFAGRQYVKFRLGRSDASGSTEKVIANSASKEGLPPPSKMLSVRCVASRNRNRGTRRVKTPPEAMTWGGKVMVRRLPRICTSWLSPGSSARPPPGSCKETAGFWSMAFTMSSLYHTLKMCRDPGTWVSPCATSAATARGLAVPCSISRHLNSTRMASLIFPIPMSCSEPESSIKV